MLPSAAFSALIAQRMSAAPMPRGPRGRFVGFYGIWKFAKKHVGCQGVVVFLSRKESARQLLEASYGHDLPTSMSFYDFETWKTVEPRLALFTITCLEATSKPP